MKTVRQRAAVAIAAGTMLAAVPAQAQFFFKSKNLAGQPVTGTEAGLSQPMPDAKPEEVRAAMVWSMRAALNVAALQCDFEPTLNTVSNYNAMLTDHKDELKKSFDTLDKYFKRVNKTPKAGQSALDQFNTKTYSGFATVAAQYNFCQTAASIGRDAIFQPRGGFGDVALARMQELRNSLTPYGEQYFSGFHHATPASYPRFDAICWNKKGVWQAKKCGPATWQPGAVPTPMAVTPAPVATPAANAVAAR